jgi:hypothetical protein
VVLAVALCAFGLEGVVKAQLAAWHVPHAIALGALALDLGLVAAGRIVISRGGLETPARIWSGTSGAARVAIGLLATWLAVSVLQGFQSGDLNSGLDGFRLTQAYAALALVGAVAAVICDRRTLVTALLAAFGVISAYAAVRTATGPSPMERAFALSRPGVHIYGHVFRAVGSFSGAVGLASYMTPVAVFAFALAALRGDRSRLAAAVFVLATVGAIATYSRAAVAGLLAGLLVVLVLGVRIGAPARARALIAVVAATFVAAGVATAVASLGDARTRSRAEGFVNPAQDESMRLRFRTWRSEASRVADHPLGTGLGTVGRASSISGPTVTTDSSFLKVLREQGPIVGSLFVIGMFGLVVVTAGSLIRLRADPVAVGALAGVVAFLVMAAFGEFVEQPGKVVFWTLLGIALASASAMPGSATEEHALPPSESGG